MSKVLDVTLTPLLTYCAMGSSIHNTSHSQHSMISNMKIRTVLWLAFFCSTYYLPSTNFTKGKCNMNVFFHGRYQGKTL